MKNFKWFSILFVVFVVLGGSMHSPAQASSAGQQIIHKIKNNPCGKLILNTGGTYSFPKAVCEGYKGRSASINVPVRGWDIKPEYPLVGVPFIVGIGIDPSSAGIDFNQKETITWPSKVKITNYKTEVRLVPYGVSGAFNGEIRGDSSMHLDDIYRSNKYKGKFHADTSLTEINLSSISDLHSQYYSKTTKSNLYSPGIDTATLVLTAFSSSYHAADPSTYKGEPAYRLEVTSTYIIEARISWDYYQFWGRKEVGKKTVCVPGTNSWGFYECELNPGSYPTWRGHYITVPVYDYVWMEKHREENYESSWIPIKAVSTNLVRWPDHKNHDHIPILVYQSQPLLQKP